MSLSWASKCLWFENILVFCRSLALFSCCCIFFTTKLAIFSAVSSLATPFLGVTEDGIEDCTSFWLLLSRDSVPVLFFKVLLKMRCCCPLAALPSWTSLLVYCSRWCVVLNSICGESLAKNVACVLTHAMFHAIDKAQPEMIVNCMIWTLSLLSQDE